MWKYQILLIFRKQFAIKSQKKKTRSCSRDPNLINFYKFLSWYIIRSKPMSKQKSNTINKVWRRSYYSSKKKKKTTK